MKSQPQSKAVPLAIIGIGSIYPEAENLLEYWSNIKNRVDSITEVPHTHWNKDDYFDPNPKTPDKTYGYRGGFIPVIDFNPLEYKIAPNAMEAIDTAQLIGLIAARQALADAGYDISRDYDKSKVSVILGITGSLKLIIPLGARLGHPIWRRALDEAGIKGAKAEEIVKRISNGYVDWQETSFPGLLGNVVAGRIANYMDFGGTNCTVDAACGSSFASLHLAVMELATGKADMVLTGGVDTFNDPFMYMCFSKTPALSTSGDARPFDANCDGTIIGEGFGMLVLKRLDDAERDGDNIYAVIRALGTSSDGAGEAVFAPKSQGQVKAMREAYESASIDPLTIELMEAHGTGTKVGEATELRSIHSLYDSAGKKRQWCALGSVKSQIGHTKAAAGSAGLIKATMGLYNKTLPPTIKVDKPMPPLDDGSSPFYVITEKRPWMESPGFPRRAAVSAFGFGGSNYHCVVEEYNKSKPHIDWDQTIEIMAFSADTINELSSIIDDLPADLSWKHLRRKALETRENFNANKEYRVIAVLEKRGTDYNKVFQTIKSIFEKYPDKSSWNTPDGAFFGRGKPKGGIGVLFPGQGSQYTGMMRDINCQFPQSFDVLTTANHAFEKNLNSSNTGRLSDYIYPVPVFTDVKKAEQEAQLRDTKVAQPALGAVNIGAYRVLQYFGLKSDAFAGHSYGELTALCAAGSITLEELHFLSALRGNLMTRSEGDPGSMLAVQEDIQQVEKAINENSINLSIANKNAPKQVVLSGATDEIQRASDILGNLGFRNKIIPVSAAFHSSLVSDAQKPFSKALNNIKFKKPQAPVFSNTTGEIYPEDEAQIRSILAGQLAKPVEFMKEIQSMYAAGIRLFLEAGPKSTLTALVKSILEDKDDFHALPLDNSKGKKSGTLDLARIIAQLACFGYSMDVKLWDPLTRQEKIEFTKPVPKMVVPINGANYMKPRPPLVFPESDISSSQKKQHSINSEAHDARSSPSQGNIGRSSNIEVIANNQSDALILTQQNLNALQALQEQTARLHQQFLENQETALRAFQSLAINQQQFFSPQRDFIQKPISSASTGILSSHSAIQKEISEKPCVTQGLQLDVNSILTEIIAEKTGYPAEMLEPDMTLDGDLGIDSIKRVEIFSALKERVPEAIAIGSEHMGNLKTLKDISLFVSDLRPSPASPPNQIMDVSTKDRSDVMGTLMEIISEKTGYPQEMLEPDMNLDSDLGIDSIKRVEIFSSLKERIPEANNVGAEMTGSLKTLKEIADYIGKNSSASPCGDTMINKAISDKADLLNSLMEIIAEKTGYPVEMLEPEMSLDSDLGIDSIKRVEIFSSIKEKVQGIPSLNAEVTGSLKTLKEIVDFLTDCGEPDPPDRPSGSRIPEASGLTDDEIIDAGSSDSLSNDEIENSLNRYVLKSKNLNGRQDDKKLEIPKKSKIFIYGNKSKIASHIAEYLSNIDAMPEFIKEQEIASMVFPESTRGLIIVAPDKGTDDSFIKASFTLMRNASSMLKKNGCNGGAVFATVSRIDGNFGLEGLQDKSDPYSGGLAGLSKTASHEWPDVCCKAIDVSPDLAPDIVSKKVAEEIFIQHPIEAGFSKKGRMTPELVISGFSKEKHCLEISNDDVIVISGGARGVTAACAMEFSKGFCKDIRPTLILLGRSTEPTGEPEWLSSLEDERVIKNEIMKRAGTKITPRQLADEYRRIKSNREILRTLKFIRDQGARAEYISVDVRDKNKTESVIKEVMGRFGMIRGLVHGAGVIADRYISDKTDQEFDMVYGTKVEGFRNLVGSISEKDLKFLVLFSSSSGRFGRKGQVDYSAANEVLNKTARSFQKKNAHCRVLSVNWGPWDGGMVTPQLKELFAGEGIGLIPMNIGAFYLKNEICSNGDNPVEVIIEGKTEKDKRNYLTGGTNDKNLCFEKTINFDELPIIKSHIIKDNAVMPMALMMEFMAGGAMQANPGLKFAGFDNIRVLKGIKIKPEQNATMRVFAGKPEKIRKMFAIPVEITTSTNGVSFELNARADAILADCIEKSKADIRDLQLGNYPHGRDLIYSRFLFHGRDLQGIETIIGCSEKGVSANVRNAPHPSQWIKKPLRNRWISDPLILDCSFQMMILWSFKNHGAGSLPVFAGSFRQYEPFPSKPVMINIEIIKDSPSNAFANIEFCDQQGVLIARMEKYECIIDPSLEGAFAQNQLV